MSELTVGTLSGLAANSYVIDVASGSQLTQPGMPLQVLSTTKTDTFSASVAGRAFSSNVTGLEVSITPSSASSKILISLNMNGTRDDSGEVVFQMMRDATAIGIGDASGTRVQVTGGISTSSTSTTTVNNFGSVLLDAPSTTSSITYGVQLYNASSTTKTYVVNRTLSDTDNSAFGRFVSTITVMEIAG